MIQNRKAVNTHKSFNVHVQTLGQIYWALCTHCSVKFISTQCEILRKGTRVMPVRTIILEWMSSHLCLTLFGHKPDLFCPYQSLALATSYDSSTAVVFVITHIHYTLICCELFHACYSHIIAQFGWTYCMLTYLLAREQNDHVESRMLMHSSINVMWSCVENLLRPTAWCAGKIKAPNKMSPKAQIPLLILSFSFHFTLSCTHESATNCNVTNGEMRARERSSNSAYFLTSAADQSVWSGCKCFGPTNPLSERCGEIVRALTAHLLTYRHTCTQSHTHTIKIIPSFSFLK